VSVIRSRDNPRVRRWQKLATSGRARRAEHRTLLEGAHVVAACLDAGATLEALIVAEGQHARAEIAELVRRHGQAPVVLAEAVFARLVTTDTPAGVAAEFAIPRQDPDPRASCVFLDGVQDAGNVGTILRSAAAFGIGDVVLGLGCADAWSPKVLRAGMGAHFGLRLATGADLEQAVGRFTGTLACTVVRDGVPLADADLRGRIGWLFGAEGRGVSAALAARAGLHVTIPMPGATESLNVAAAAAICFYERARQLSRPAARS
jgi:TrmH family RNA methyltransferase